MTVQGSGPDVVLIPGLTSSPDVWASTVAAVPGYRYHLVHVSGFAGRPSGANASGPVVAPVAEEIARYIREQRLNRPALVGHSMGGSWAMMVAGRHPELAGRVMVVDMMPFMAAMFGGPARHRTAPSHGRADAGRHGEQPGRGAAPTDRADDRDHGPHRIARPALVEQGMTSDPVVAAQAMYDLIVTDLRPEVARIQVPFTVLWVRPPNAPVTEEQMVQFYRFLMRARRMRCSADPQCLSFHHVGRAGSVPARASDVLDGALTRTALLKRSAPA